MKGKRTPAGKAPSPRARDLRAGSPWPWMAAVFALALAVRLAYLAAFRSSPFFGHLIVDGQWHDEWAWALARGAWSMDGHAFFRAPLYPFWLSLLYRGFGHDPGAVRAVQAVLGAGTAAALAGCAHRLAGRTAGLVAGVFAALYGPLIFFDAELLIPNLLLSLLAWALFLLLARPRWEAWLGAGALLGLAAAARPNAIVLLPAAAAWAGWRGRVGSRGLGWRPAAAVLALGVLPAAILTGMNAASEGTFVFVSSQGGVNFYGGNNPAADGRSVSVPELRDLVSWREFVSREEAIAEKAVGRPLDSSEVSAWWTRRGLAWLAGHPGRAAALYARKLYYLVNGFEIPNNRDLYFRRPGLLKALLWTTPVFDFPWGLLLPLAVAGFALALADRRLRAAAWLLGSWWALYALTLLPFFITARYRLPLLLPLFILAGIAAARWRSALRGWPLAAGAAALIAANSGLAGARVENPAQELARIGEIQARSGNPAEAVRTLEEARRRDPRSVTTTYLLAEAYDRAGRTGDAARLYAEVEAARPDDPDVRFNLGVAFLRLERYDDASHELEVATRLRPGDAAAWVNLGVAYENLDRFAAAAQAYTKGIALAPGEALGYLRLAGLRGGAGDLEGAARALTEGAAHVPGSFDLHYQLALVYVRERQFDRARAETAAALRLAPRDPDAGRLRDWLRSHAGGDSSAAPGSR